MPIYRIPVVCVIHTISEVESDSMDEAFLKVGSKPQDYLHNENTTTRYGVDLDSAKALNIALASSWTHMIEAIKNMCPNYKG